MPDGTIKIAVDIDASKLAAQVKAQESIVKKFESALKSSNQALDQAKTKQDQIGSSLDQAKQKYAALQSEIKKLKSAYDAEVEAQSARTDAATEMAAGLEALNSEYAQAGKEIDKLQRQYDKSGNSVEKAASQVRQSESAYQGAINTQIALQRSLNETNLKLKQQSSVWAVAMKSAEEAGRKQAELGKILTVGLTTPITAIGTYAAKSAIDFESAFAGVEKTVDGTVEQMAALREGIIDMSTSMPQTAAQLSDIAAAAGQLGVSTEKVLDFSKVIADLKESTNLGEEAAATLAKFKNVTKMSEDEYSNLGSAIVDLGNNFSTTEADIVAMSMRLAGAGTQVGLTQSQILGFATALSSVGIEAEAGGSSFSRIMTKMQLAAETGGDGLKDFAKVAGMSSKQFQTAFKKDAAGAIQAFIVGLSKMDEKGISAIKTLDDMGIKEIRLSDTLLRASNAEELFASALQTSSNAWRENTALTIEADKRYATFASRLQIVRNQATAAAQSIGEAFIMPALESGLNKVTGWLDAFEQMSEEGKQAAVTFVALAAGIGPTLTVLGKTNEMIGKFSTGLQGLSFVASAAGGGLSGFGAALSTILGPAGYIALAAAGIYGLVKAFQWLSDQVPSIGDEINKAFDAFNPEEMQLRAERMKKTIDANISIKTTTTITEEGTTAQQKLDELFQPIIDQLEAGKPVSAKLAVNVNQSVVNFADSLIDGIKSDLQAKIEQLDADLELGKIDATEYETQVAALKQDAESAIASLEALKTASASAVNAMVGDTNLTVEDVKSTFSTLLSETKTGTQAWVDYVNGISGLITVGTSVEESLSKVFQPIKDALETGEPVDAKLAVNVTDAVVSFADTLISGIETDAQTKIDELSAKLKLGEIDTADYNAQVEKIKEDAAAAKESLENMKTSATTLVNGMVGDTSLTISGVETAITSLYTTTTDGTNKFIEYVNGIPGLITISSLFSTIETSLTDGKPDDPNWLKSQVEDVFSGQIEAINTYINDELAKLDINDPNYDAAKKAITDKGEDMVSQLTDLQTAANEFIDRMSGKATSTVLSHMGELAAIEQRAQEVIRSIQAAVDADRQQAGTRAGLIKGGYVRDTAIIEETLAVTFADYQIDLQSARAQAEAAKEEVMRLFQAGEISAEEVQPKIDEIDAALSEYERGITTAYQRELDQLMAGVTKAYGTINPELQAAADKVDMAGALRSIYDKIESGTIQKSDITPKIAEAVGLDVDTLWQMIQDGLDNPDPLMGKLNLEQMFKGVADQIETEALSGVGKDLGEPGKILNTAIMNGLYDDLEGVDMSDGVTKYMAMLGKLLKDPGYMKEPVPIDMALDPILHPPEDGGTEARNEAREQIQDQLQTGDDTGVDVEVPVNPKADVKEPTGGDSVAEQISESIEKQTQNAPPVKTEISVEPEAKIETPSGETSPVDAIRDSIAEDAEKPTEPIPVEVTLSATMKIDEASNTSAQGVGAALAQSVATGINTGQGIVTGAASKMVSSAKEAARGAVAGANFQSIGTQMDAGIAAGITAGKSIIINAATAVALAAKQAFETALGIASPAKEMIPDGEYVTEGIAVGIIKATPLVEYAMYRIGEVITAMAASNAEKARASRMEAIQDEIAAIEAQLDEYEHMMEEKRQQEELAEKRAAVKRAKNKKDRKKAQEELNRYLAELENERLADQRDFLKAEMDAYQENVDTLVKAYDFLGDQIITALKNRYETEREMQLERLEAEYDASVEAAERLYDSRKAYSEQYLAQLEAEKDAEIAALQGRIDALNAEARAEKDAEREAADAARIAELQAAVARAKNAKFRAEAQAKLDAELEKQAKEARERERQAEIESLKNQISDAKDNFDEQKQLEEQRMDEVEAAYKAQIDLLKSTYEQQRKVTESHYKELLSTEKLNAEARRLLLQDSNDEMIALLESYNPEWYNAGKSFGELFVEALGVQMENVNELIERAASFAQNRLDWIKAQINAMSNTGSSGYDNAANNPAMQAPFPGGGYTYVGGSSSKSVEQDVYINIYQPVQSPSEIADAVRRAAQEAAYAI